VNNCTEWYLFPDSAWHLAFTVRVMLLELLLSPAAADDDSAARLRLDPAPARADASSECSGAEGTGSNQSS